MRNVIKRWLAPSAHHYNEDTTRRIYLLNAIIGSTALFVFLILIGNLIGGRTPLSNMVIDLLIIVVALLLRLSLRSGKVLLVSLGMGIAGFILTTAVIASQGSIRTPATATFLFIVVMSGMLYELRGILVSTIASSIAVAGLILAENAGLLPPPDYTNTITQWIRYTVLFGMTGSLAYFAHQITRQALERANQEVGDRARVETELRKLTRAVEQSPSSVVITNLQGDIEYVNPRFTQVTGYPFAEAVGKNPRILKTDLTPANTHVDLWESLTAGNEWRGEFVNRKKDGSLYYESANISPITDLNGNVTHYLAIKEDITERKRVEADLQATNEQLSLRVAEVEMLQVELREQALRDPLTGLYNRRYLNETMPRELLRSAREKICLSVIIGDIDFFKKINDTFGHQVGDQFLVEVARTLEECTRGSDLVCRYGGEEFLLLLPGTDAASGMQRAETLRKKCAEIALSHEGQVLQATISFGVAVYPDHGDKAEQIILKADKALYISKHTGRNRVTLWDEAAPAADPISP
jgi:diguanylate cyclase (GGDEF)-like protein/PAS domain S-box-containing protein